MNRLDLQTGQVKHLLSSEELGALSASAVLSLAQNPDGRILVGTWEEGLNLFDPSKEMFEHFVPEDGDIKTPSHRNIWAVAVDMDGDLWFGPSGGLSSYDKRTDTFSHYFRDDALLGSLKSDTVLSVYEDSRGWIWLGTKVGVSYFDDVTPSFTTLGRSDGLA